MAITIKIPFEPISVNGLYAVLRGRKVKTYKGRLYADKVYHICQNLKISQDELLKVRIEVFGKWWNLNGTLKKKDLANYEKATIDAIFANLEADDAQIIEFEMVKMCDVKEYSVVYIELLDKNHNFYKGQILPNTMKRKSKVKTKKLNTAIKEDK